jgi:hypothetical protein
VSTLSRLVLLFAVATSLGACVRSNADGLGPPSTSHEFALTIVARTASGAPDGYGIVPGNVVVGAKVSVRKVGSHDSEVASGITNESGRLVVLVSSGNYQAYVERETHDPYCTWYSSAEVEVKNKPTKVSVDDLWVLCE